MMISSKVKIQAVPGKGVGLVASQDIEAGEVVVRERPVLVVDQWSPHHLLEAWQDLAPPDRASYSLLANSHPEVPPLVGVALTNMIPLSRDNTKFGVFLTVARINHSCQANSNHYQENQTGDHTEAVRAVRKIAGGEEVTISYRWNIRERIGDCLLSSRNPMEQNFVTREERRKLLSEVNLF